jgi:Ca2+-binding RTX toxin-like protein
VNINGVTNQGAVDKGADGLDTFIDVEKPMDAGFTTGGLRISGSAGNDVFNVTVDSDQWMSIRGFDGSDTFNISGAGLVRLNYQREGAINADLTTGVITHDGFADQVNGTIWEIRASDGADTILGSGADESFILRQGNDTLDAGGGIDRLRYDRFGVDGVTADMGTGTVTGIWEGAAFTHTFSNVEWLRGSDGNDRITGSANADRLEGRGGNDTIVGGQGNDFILLGGGADTYVFSGGIDVLGDFEVGIDSIVIDIPGVTQAQSAGRRGGDVRRFRRAKW